MKSSVQHSANVKENPRDNRTNSALSQDSNMSGRDHLDDPVVKTPPTYPEVLNMENIDLNPPPEPSHLSGETQSPQQAYLSHPRFYPHAQSVPTTYDEDGFPPAKGRNGGSGSAGRRYAWHNSRLASRSAAIFSTLLAVFLDIGFSSLECRYQYYCFLTVTMVVVSPLALAWNTVELITIGSNGRGIHPAPVLVVDFIMFAGLVTGGAMDLTIGWLRYLRYYVGAVQIVAATFQLGCVVLGCLALWRLRTEKKAWGKRAIEEGR